MTLGIWRPASWAKARSTWIFKNGVQVLLEKGARKRCLLMQDGAVVKSRGDLAAYAARLYQRHG